MPIVDACSARLPRAKRPHRVYQLHERADPVLPRLANGKPDQRRLEALAARLLAGTAMATPVVTVDKQVDVMVQRLI